MKRIRIPLIITIAIFMSVLSAPLAAAGDHFSVKEYDVFHDLLHPLEHEALPAKDFPRIRTNAADLVKRGKAILRVGMPAATSERYHEDFRKELKKFKTALDRLSKDAKRGTDTQLEASFSAVHDSFEMLAGMLPRK